MFNDDFLCQIFAHEEMQKIPVGFQSIAVHVLEEILSNKLEENPYASISELFAENGGE